MMERRLTMKMISRVVAVGAYVGVLMFLVVASACGGGGGQQVEGEPPPSEVAEELQQDAASMVIRPEDFAPTHFCDRTASPGLAPGEYVEWCRRTPPPDGPGQEACVLSGAFLFPEPGDAQRFFGRFEARERLELARQEGFDVQDGTAPELGDEAVLHVVSSQEADFCAYAATSAEAVWLSVRQDRVVVRLELWVLEEGASTEEAAELAAKQLRRVAMVPLLQPSQFLLRESDLPPGFMVSQDVPFGLWGRVVTFSDEGERPRVASFAAPFRSSQEATTVYSDLNPAGLVALAARELAPPELATPEDLGPLNLADAAKAVRIAAADGQEAYVVVFRRGPAVGAVLVVGEPGGLSLADAVSLAEQQADRIDDILE